MPNAHPLSDSLPFAADFMTAVLSATEASSAGSIDWADINRLAAQWLRPGASAVSIDTSRIGHAVIVEMARHDVLEAELTTAANGDVIAQRVLQSPLSHAAARLAA